MCRNCLAVICTYDYDYDTNDCFLQNFTNCYYTPHLRITTVMCIFSDRNMSIKRLMASALHCIESVHTTNPDYKKS